MYTLEVPSTAPPAEEPHAERAARPHLPPPVRRPGRRPGRHGPGHRGTRTARLRSRGRRRRFGARYGARDQDGGLRRHRPGDRGGGRPAAAPDPAGRLRPDPGRGRALPAVREPGVAGLRPDLPAAGRLGRVHSCLPDPRSRRPAAGARLHAGAVPVAARIRPGEPPQSRARGRAAVGGQLRPVVRRYGGGLPRLLRARGVRRPARTVRTGRGLRRRRGIRCGQDGRVRQGHRGDAPVPQLPSPAVPAGDEPRGGGRRSGGDGQLRRVRAGVPGAVRRVGRPGPRRVRSRVPDRGPGTAPGPGQASGPAGDAGRHPAAPRRLRRPRRHHLGARRRLALARAAQHVGGVRGGLLDGAHTGRPGDPAGRAGTRPYGGVRRPVLPVARRLAADLSAGGLGRRAGRARVGDGGPRLDRARGRGPRRAPVAGRGRAARRHGGGGG